MEKKFKNPEILNGIIHKVPKDILEAIENNQLLIEKWNLLTPIARNEWICWTTIVKKTETRKNHINRLCSEILEGKKRPCCWPGCPHRRDTEKYFTNKKSKKIKTK